MLALVHLPSYDANVLSRGISEEELQTLLNDPRNLLLDGAIGSAYPTGSLFQAITAAGALQEGVVKGDQKVDCPSALTIPSRLDPSSAIDSSARARRASRTSSARWRTPARPTSTSPAAATQRDGRPASASIGCCATRGSSASAPSRGSSSTASQPARSRPRTTSRSRLEDKTNIEWYKGDTLPRSPIGEDYVRATALQLANAFAAIANGGTLYQPQLVLEVVGAEREVGQHVPAERRSVGSPSPPRTSRSSARGFARRSRRARRESARPTRESPGTSTSPGLDLAGMVATVDDVGPNGEKLTHGWFAGYGPSSDPRVAVAVFVERGRGAEDAGELAKAILSYYLSR